MKIYGQILRLEFIRDEEKSAKRPMFRGLWGKITFLKWKQRCHSIFSPEQNIFFTAYKRICTIRKGSRCSFSYTIFKLNLFQTEDIYVVSLEVSLNTGQEYVGSNSLIAMRQPSSVSQSQHFTSNLIVKKQKPWKTASNKIK